VPLGLARRTVDLTLPSLALLMCGWLLLHTGSSGLVAAATLAVLGLAVGRRLPERGTDASPGPAFDGARTPRVPTNSPSWPWSLHGAFGLHCRRGHGAERQTRQAKAPREG
jgi:hypothetical protein